MVLIAILIALVVQRFANLAGWFSPSWFELYLGWFRPFLARNNKWVSIVIVILPVFLVLGVLHGLLMMKLFGLFYLVLATLVLLLCMDARNLQEILAKYFAHAEKQEVDAAVAAMSELTSEPLAHSLPELNRSVTKFIFVKNYTNVFAVLFWFGLLNIYGAVGYMMLALLRKYAVKVDGSFKDIADSAGFLQDLLDWVPVRVLGLTYALVGHFGKASAYCFKHLQLEIKDNLNFVINSGLAALDANSEESVSNLQENYQALALGDRALIVWIVAIALVTLGMLL